MNELYYGTPELPDLDDIDYMIGDGIPLQAKVESGIRDSRRVILSNAKDLETSASSAFTFDDKALAEALKRIYSQEFRPMIDIEEHLFDETLRIMLQATDEGWSQAQSRASSQEESEANLPSRKSSDFRTLIDWNTARWSAFKVHRMQNDIAAQLYDEDGTLKPFDRWAKDVEPMLDHHVGHWLRTEYNTAVTRAQQAADWKRFEENADIMPNLTWIPSTSAQPGADHKIYWGVTLPIDHPFWNSHRPGDRWGCKCSLENTDDEPTAIPDDTDPKRNQPADGLDTNPGKDGKLFSDSHPYIKTATREAKKAVEKYMEEKVNLPKPIKVKIEPDEVEYETYPTQKGLIRIHPGHGKNEKKENLEVASYLANKYGYEIELLDNPPNVKSADTFNYTLDVKQEYKISRTPTKSSVDNLIRDARKQADDIVLKLEADISLVSLSKAIHSRVRRSENIKSVTVIINGKSKLYHRGEIMKKDFIIQQADLE